MHAEATSAYWLRAPPWGALCRIDDTGATFSIVRLERVTRLPNGEFEQCKRWHLPRRSETDDEIGRRLARRSGTRKDASVAPYDRSPHAV